VQLNAASVEANIAGTPEGNVAQQSQQGQAPPTSAGGGASASGMANGINTSQNEAATGSAGAGGGSTPTTSQPAKDPLAAATGQETRTSTAKVVIIVKVP